MSQEDRRATQRRVNDVGREAGDRRKAARRQEDAELLAQAKQAWGEYKRSSRSSDGTSGGWLKRLFRRGAAPSESDESGQDEPG